jgi:hypothetical protein
VTHRLGNTLNAYSISASIALAVLLVYVGQIFPSIQHLLRSAGYGGTFVLGLLYAHGFTAFPAAALLFLMGRSQNLWLAGTIATSGAVASDFVTFALFRSAKGFAEEHPHKKRYAGWWAAIDARIPPSWQPFVMVAVAAVFLLLPLPNEFADYLLARTQKVKATGLFVISAALNGISIYTILWLARFR